MQTISSLKSINSHDATNHFNEINNKPNGSIDQQRGSVQTTYFTSSQYKHFDRFDPTIHDDVIFEEQLTSLLTYFTQPLEVEIVQEENEILKQVKLDIEVEIQSVMVDIHKKSKPTYLEMCSVFGSELQAESFPKSYFSVGDEAFILQNACLKTEIRTLLSILTFLKTAQKELNDTIKELNSADSIFFELEKAKNEIREENDDLKKLRLVEFDIKHSNQTDA
ncbi:Uncharacterized protein QTN25_003313 [Entamoeba marina]